MISMSEQQFLWNSLDGGENVFIKERESDKNIHIKIIEGKHEFVDFMKKVNDQQDTIITLKRRLEKINGGYGLLTHRNGLTANEWVIESQERELKKKNEQISDWIEQHSKDIATISKQKHTISQLEEENDNMNLFIKKIIQPLLLDCVFELNTIETMSQVELASKIEDEIIPFIQDFKYLKYESPEEEKQDQSE